MPLQELARENVVHAGPDTPVNELADRLRDESVGSVVITNGTKPVGIVTDRDIATRALTQGSSGNDLTAADLMTDNVITGSNEMGLYEAGEMMSQHGVRRLPICDEQGELCGIITADDVLELLAEESQHLASIIQSQRPPY